MCFHVKEKTLVLNGEQVDYITFGKGKKPLVMIQGLSTRNLKGSGFSLAIAYRIFAKEYTVYWFDRRKNVCEGTTILDLAKDFAKCMDILNIKNADIFAVSQGGMIAQELAIERPDLVRKLVLAVTLCQNNETVEKVINDWVQMAEQGQMKKLVYDMAEKLYSQAYLKRYKFFMPLLVVLQKPKDVKRFVILAKSCLTCDTAKRLKEIKQPVLVLGGKQDKIVGANACEKIAQLLKCEIFLYENLGHAVYEEAKDFNKKVLEFFVEK